MTSVSAPASSLGHRPVEVAESAYEPRAGESAMAGIASLLLRNRISVIRAGLVGGLLAGIITILPGRTYTSSFSFTPQEAATRGGLASIAIDLGMNLGGSLAQSPEFYVDLLHTRQILGNLLQQKFVVTSDEGRREVTLLDLIEPDEGKSVPKRRASAMEELATRIQAGFSMKTNVVWVSAQAESPDLALQLAQRIIAEINRFNSETRRTQSTAERIFTEQRLAETKIALQEAERRQVDFIDQNRSLSNSASLLVRRNAVDREAGLVGALYTDLSRALFQARLEEVRNTPLVTIIEQPEAPVLPNSRKTLVKVLFGGIMGASFIIFVSFVRESLSRSRKSTVEAHDELVTLWHNTMDDLRHPMRFLRTIVTPQRRVPS